MADAMIPPTPLLIAAHGTRNHDGLAACRAVVARIRARLPDTDVEVGFVELTEPSIAEALAELLAREAAAGRDPRAVVAPLMLGTGGHVRGDIPEAIEQALAATPGAWVGYGRPLGADPRLLRAVEHRIAAAVTDAPALDPRQVCVVFLGRGAAVADANADHARLARLLFERGRFASVVPAFVQVTRPSLPEALGQARALGARQIVVAPNLLLPGMLSTWVGQQLAAWRSDHPDVEVRLAEVVGDCEELAEVLIDRYREVADDPNPQVGAPVYLTGLHLTGREVLVVGAGQVADRRVPRLLEAGARVRLVSPTLSVRLRRRLGEERLTWHQRPFREDDLDGAWFVLALSNDPEVNARVARGAEARHTFCVRADAADLGSAWTPAVERAAGLTVAVIGNRDPRRSVRVRDAVLRALYD